MVLEIAKRFDVEVMIKRFYMIRSSWGEKGFICICSFDRR